MTLVYTAASTSLDGYIAGPDVSGFDHLFKWYGNGDVVVPTADPNITGRMTPASAAYFSGVIAGTGSLVVGRKLFDFTSGWGGLHTLGCHVFVVTHEPPEGTWENFTFVTDGVESAVEQARKRAGDKAVGVNGGSIASQCLDAGILDEIWVDLVPVLLGDGVPYFSSLGTKPVALEGPISVVESVDVTHLKYRVVR